MVRIARWLGIGLAGIVMALFVVVMLARQGDGPIAIIAGGPLEAGELVSSRGVDWSFVTPVPEIELQLLEPPRSRTVWAVSHQGALFVPCGFLSMPLWKQWPYQALEDGRAVVRVLGKRYEVQAKKVEEPELYQTVAGLVADKYALPRSGPADPEELWIFRLDPRS